MTDQEIDDILNELAPDDTAAQAIRQLRDQRDRARNTAITRDNELQLAAKILNLPGHGPHRSRTYSFNDNEFWATSFYDEPNTAWDTILIATKGHTTTT